jgi:hypothetical protein
MQYRLHLVARSEELHRKVSELGDVLLREDLETALPKHGQAYPYVILVDVSEYGRAALRFVAKLRNRMSAARIPVIAFVSAEQPGEFKEALYRQQECYVMDESCGIEELRQQLEMILDIRYRERSEGDPHPHALELLARIWREGLSGEVQAVGHPGKTALCNGGITDVDGEGLLRKGLEDSGFLFEAAEGKGFGDWLTVSEILWSAACRCTAPGFLRERKNLSLVATEFTSRAEDMPMAEETEKLLSALPSPLSLNKLMEDQEVRFSLVEADIEALYILGLCSFSRPQVKESSPKKKSEMRETEAAALLAEIDSRGETPLDVLQIGKPEELLLAAEKATQQLRLLEDLSSSIRLPTLRDLAERLYRRTAFAQTMLTPLSETYRYFGSPAELSSKEEGHFMEAIFSLQTGKEKDAYAGFSRALVESPSSARNLSHALWLRGKLLPTKAMECREGLLELAGEHPHNPLIETFVIELELGQGMLAEGEARASKLLHKHGKQPRLERLLQQLGKEQD